MRLVFRSLIVLTLALGLLLPGCGTGGDSGDFFGLTPGPFTFGVPLPVFGGSVDFLALSNKSGETAVVFVTGYTPAGGMYPSGMTKHTIAPLSTLRLSLSSLLGGTSFGGFAHVETRDAETLDADGLPTAVPTSGYVYPSLDRRIGGVNPAADTHEGFAWRSAAVNAGITPETTALHVFNASHDFAAVGAIPKAVDFTLTEYDVDGTAVFTGPVSIGPKSTFTYTPTVPYGMLSATPMAGFADEVRVGMRGCERDFYTSIESRFKRDRDDQIPGLKEIGFEVEHGEDFSNNTYDFGMLLNNPTDDDKTVVLTGIYRGNGAAPILTTPRFFIVTAHSTVFMATTNALSAGLKLGEDSFFDDVFGDVFLASSFESATIALQVPRGVNASVRCFDPAFDSFYVIKHGLLRTAQAAALDIEFEPFLGTGNFNEVILTNLSTNPLLVPIRMTTPGGTEYLLDSVTVPAQSRFLWSPDGLLLREDPTDTLGPLVRRGCFRFSPLSGMLFRARRREVNNVGAIILVTPYVVRDLQDDDVF